VSALSGGMSGALISACVQVTCIIGSCGRRLTLARTCPPIMMMCQGLFKQQAWRGAGAAPPTLSNACATLPRPSSALARLARHLVRHPSPRLIRPAPIVSPRRVAVGRLEDAHAGGRSPGDAGVRRQLHLRGRVGGGASFTRRLRVQGWSCTSRVRAHRPCNMSA
jgi:hypothetical protein